MTAAPATVAGADLGEHVGELLVQVAAVDEAGQGVVADGVGEAVDQPAVAQREAGVVGERLDQAQVGGVEGAHLADPAGHHQAAGDLGGAGAAVGLAVLAVLRLGVAQRNRERFAASDPLQVAAPVRHGGTGRSRAEAGSPYRCAAPARAPDRGCRVPAAADRCRRRRRCAARRPSSSIVRRVGRPSGSAGAKTISACSAAAISRAESSSWRSTSSGSWVLLIASVKPYSRASAACRPVSAAYAR